MEHYSMDISIILTAILAMWNGVTFTLMGMDKSRAKKGKWRISEKRLLISAFLFGGIGIVCGMYIFRHKTKNIIFRILVPLFLVINIVLEMLLVLLLLKFAAN